MALDSKYIFNHQQPEAEAMVKWLSSYGQSKHGGVSRLLYSSSWINAQHALKAKMEEIGLTTYFDSVGNLFGRLEGSNPQSPIILTGSHIDSVIDGGMYDGVYGIIASLLSVKRLIDQHGQPNKTIEVVSLCEEEGSRFPLTFWGSGNMTGRYSLKDGTRITDGDGIKLLDAMKTAGFDPEQYETPVRDDIGCFIELHVEQGITLERTNKSLGIVSHIVGQRRFNIRITGESNHAGTTPMNFRKDAMLAASHLITFINKKAQETDPQLVATTGKLTAKPNVPNVIAGEVLFTLDVRHYDEQTLDQFCQELSLFFIDYSKEHEMEIEIDQWMSVKPVMMDSTLTNHLTKIAQEKGFSYSPIVSGAGHDAQVFGTHCPTALLFVPSENGVSHSPKESTKKEDLEKGRSVLTELLYQLAYHEEG
ncbi:allantoate deiminase [Litchfieldia salsa]|uniref:Allantoate deiminase n=1 Tax=Litchfieldia salsa TaxID=930152 RepID=A0A1H0U9V9_9BACI|nr:allantoate deiminase [Litchfieldia salsa]SDP62775.1 allantoate deiminase [Litchfieldia salsa]